LASHVAKRQLKLLISALVRHDSSHDRLIAVFRRDGVAREKGHRSHLYEITIASVNVPILVKAPKVNLVRLAIAFDPAKAVVVVNHDD
jgi:hypothetical protein